MSEATEIVVIGGGAMGLACAWQLASAGKQVTLLERRHCGSGASSAALGALWASTSIHTPLHAMHHQSLCIMTDVCEDLQRLTGVDCGYQRCGRIELISNPVRARQLRDEIETDQELHAMWDVDPVMELLSPGQLKEIEPHVHIENEAVLQCHITAKLDPKRFIAALQQACVHHGVTIHEQCSVDELRFSHDRVQSIVSSKGTFCAEQVLVTAGAWIRMIDEALHQEVPVKPVRGQGIRFQCSADWIAHIIKKDGIYLIPQADHQIIVGSTTEMHSGYDENTTPEGLERLEQGAFDLLPPLQHAERIDAWAGLRPMGMDKRPFLGKSPQFRNVYYAAGFYKIGLGMAPLAARVIRDEIGLGKTAINIQTLRPGRIER